MAFFGNLMNNYFYGKAGKGDYTIENMPQNRRQLFGEVMKVRWASLFGVNLLYMIFWIPAIAWTFLNLNALMAVAASDSEDAIQQAWGYISYYLLFLFPCIAITGPFNAGVTYVLRNWARDEHSFVLSDFKDAVKANWKQSLVISMVSGALPFLLYVCLRFYGGMLSQSVIYIVPLALVILVVILWTMSSMIMYDMLITYDLKLRDVIRNSLLLTLAKLPFALLIKLMRLAVPILMALIIYFAPDIEMHVLLIGSLIYLVYLVAFNKLFTVSYANWLCETYLNTRIEGAPTGIGLRPENWDDVTYIPEDDE